MDAQPEGEAEAMDWELLHHHNTTDDADAHHGAPVNELAPPLDSSPLIRPDYFSIHPPTPLSSNSSSSSSSSTDVDRNFDDSYLANQLFPFLHSHPQHQSSSSAASSNNLPLSHDSDSDSDSKAPIVLQTTTDDLLLDTQAADAAGALDSKEAEEEENKEMEEEGVVKGEERSAVWWKVPLEVFKYWVVRVSPVPVWSLSVAAAAAFLGLVILGRRLYKMKRKTQTLKLNVALDDKKVSQLMGRVARLNEAFSVVRRVPIVRPSLPAPPSVTLRPVMSIR